MRRIRAGHAAVAATVLLLALVVGATAGLGASDRSTGFKLTIGDIEAYTGDLGSLGAPADKAVALGYLNLPYGVGIYQVFSKGWEGLGGTVVAVGYAEDQASYDSEAQKLVGANPAAFVFADYPDTFGKVGAALLRTGKYSAS